MQFVHPWCSRYSPDGRHKDVKLNNYGDENEY
jgi:hypothetical protein